jgi:hypothetical protein
MATNIKIKKIIKNSKMKIFQWKWIFTGSKTCCETNFRPNQRILYFGGHFGFKMAAIANRNGRNMVQHVLLPVNIHFH